MRFDILAQAKAAAAGSPFAATFLVGSSDEKYASFWMAWQYFRKDWLMTNRMTCKIWYSTFRWTVSDEDLHRGYAE